MRTRLRNGAHEETSYVVGTQIKLQVNKPNIFTHPIYRGKSKIYPVEVRLNFQICYKI